MCLFLGPTRACAERPRTACLLPGASANRYPAGLLRSRDRYQILNRVSLMAVAATSYYVAFFGPDAGSARRSPVKSRQTSASSAAASPAARLPCISPSAATGSSLLEAQRIGYGASGRSGGQAIAGYACGQQKLEQQVGFENARRMWDISVEGLQLIRDRVARHAIDCDLHWGQLHVAIKERQRAELLAEQREPGESLRLSAAAIHGARRGGVAARDEAVLRRTLRRRQRASSSAELHARPGRGGTKPRACRSSRTQPSRVCTSPTLPS